MDTYRIAIADLGGHMSESVNVLKDKALQILLTESFRYINQLAYEEQFALAQANARVRGVTASFFMYAGDIYPDKTKNGESVRLVNVVAPPLHYSLYEEFDAINKRSVHAGIMDVSNYFRAVLSYSVNGIVLDELLPAVLVNALKGEFTDEEFSLINYGVYTAQIPRIMAITGWEPIEATRKTIEDIKRHYANTILILRDQLMNKLLLASV